MEVALLNKIPFELTTSELIYVSVGQDGSLNWAFQRVRIQETESTDVGIVGRDPMIVETVPLESSPVFRVHFLGHGSVVSQMLDSTAPWPGMEGSVALQRYYSLKASHKLDDMTLDDAVELAKALIRGTYQFCPHDCGVGGNIDIATVTERGFEAVQLKKTVAPLPPPFVVRMIEDHISGKQELDSLSQCVRCVFIDSTLSYNGIRSVELVEPIVQGTCVLTFTKEAFLRQPKAAAQIAESFKGKCIIRNEADLSSTNKGLTNQY